MIPEAKKTAVTNALQVAFGVNEFEAISEMNAGLSSALIFRIVVLGKAYLLRIITRTDALSDPARYYNCMKMAAEAGLAPRIWYAGAEDRISITDFIEVKPFPISKAKILMPDALRRLHALPLFPFRLNYLDFADNNIRKLATSKVLPETIATEALKNYEKIIKIYPRNEEDLVSCHNDLKPDNVLFDGERVWLVDWEAAFLNDRYIELAVVANFVITNEGEEQNYLQRYFGEEATQYRQARFLLAQQLLHIIYFSFFINLSTPENKPVDLNITVPGFRELHDLLWQGKINLLDQVSQQQYAFVHFKEMTRDDKQKKIEDAVSIVSGYHRSA